MAEEFKVAVDYYNRHTLNDDGTRVLKTEQFRKGDKITFDDADEAQRLVDAGAIVAKADPIPDGLAGAPVAVQPAAVSGQTAEQSARVPGDPEGDSEAGAEGASDLGLTEEGEGGAESDYSSMTKAELVAEIERRNDAGASLAKSGNHDELVDRLEADDAAE